MSTDPLRAAVRALKESADASPAHPDETRARVLASLRKQHDHRLFLIKTVIPLAAILVGSLAWAATDRFPGLWQAAVQLFNSASEPALEAQPAAAPSRRGGPSERSAVAVAPVMEESAVAPAPVIEASPEALPPLDSSAAGTVSEVLGTARATSSTPAVGLRGSVAAPGTALAPPAPASLAANAPRPTPPAASAAAAGRARVSGSDSADELALYEAAHRLHFGEHNPRAALGAWDAYLHATPNGRFAVEAQYNRALCLARLGRNQEAAHALEAFAKGSFGGYRQTEARALLEALRGESL